MASKVHTIGVCNGGGDCPGLNAAIRLARGEYGRMVCLRAGKIESVPLADAIGSCKLVDPASDYVSAGRAVGITFGDRP
jgi:6-phosphofructokinase